MFKFIHTADLHIDSPLRGLAATDLEMHQRLQSATRAAFENVVNIAIEQEVAFVLIAGDLFDGDWRDMQTGQWTASQFRKLEKEGIKVFYIRGNHDADSVVRKSIRWPSNVFELSVRKPETIQLDEINVAIHGQGFKDRELLEDIAATYPQATDGHFNIGMLHTSLTGNEGHDTYAPTNVETLKSKGYDYWALGHIHLREEQPICQQPYIAYSGNTQGRHIKETGAKGCFVVSVHQNELQSVDFHETDLLRWQEAVVDLKEEDDLEACYDQVRKVLATVHRENDGRFSAVRLILQGRCAAHRELGDALIRSEVLSEINNIAAAVDDQLWIEKVKFSTQPLLSVEQRRRSTDLLGQLLNEINEVRSKPEALEEFALFIDPVLKKCEAAGVALQWEEESEHQKQAWLDQAEALLLANLEEAS